MLVAAGEPRNRYAVGMHVGRMHCDALCGSNKMEENVKHSELIDWLSFIIPKIQFRLKESVLGMLVCFGLKWLLHPTGL